MMSTHRPRDHHRARRDGASQEGALVIEFAEISVGSGGIARCVACGAPEPRVLRASAQIVAEIDARTLGWNTGPGPNFAFVGTEPFAHPELPALVAAAVAAGAQRIRLRTDAGALAIPGNAAGVIHAGVRQVEVVLLGGDASIHDALAGRAGLFDAALEGLRAFSSAALAVDAHVAVCAFIPVCAHNLTQLPAAVSACASAGAVSAVLSMPAALSGSSAAREWIGAALDTGTVNGVWVSVQGVAADTLPRSPLYARSPTSTLGGAR